MRLRMLSWLCMLVGVISTTFGVAAIARPVDPPAPEAAPPSQTQPTPRGASFRVVFDSASLPTPYTGRVYVVISTSDRGEPRRQMGNWGNPAQMFVRDVTGIAPGG